MKKNSVIQIGTDVRVRQEFHGKLAIIDEVKSWGVQAYVQGFEGDYYIRLVTGTFVHIGELQFIPLQENE